jgi:iron(III) transport system substrate-binding protein
MLFGLFHHSGDKMKIPIWIILTLVTTSLFLNGCNPGISVTATPIPALETPVLIKPQLPNISTETPSLLGQYMIPAYYTDSYTSIVNGSKAEGKLVIYSIMSKENWDPIIRIFNSHYPWIKVATFDLRAVEVFTRYGNDVKENKRTADIVVSSDQVGWYQFFTSDILPYRSQEDSLIPDWAKSVFGTYTVSSDPMVIVYNKKLVPVPPKSMSDLAGLVKSDPEGYKGQIVTYDAELDATGFAINWFWIDKKGQAGWDILNILGKTQPVLMTSEGNIINAVGNGQAKIGYFVSATTVLSRLGTYPDLGWNYITDGQPILLRNMAITQKAASPNSAKLMIDFILSQEGQYALALGGLTPYRSDISGVTEYHLDKISAELGDTNVILLSFNDRLRNQSIEDIFIEKWKTAMQK